MTRWFYAFFTVLVITAVTGGCGGPGELGSVNGSSITEEEYLAVFNGLPPEEQVNVLEPGGRMALMDRIVTKKLLMLAWQEEPGVSAPWEELYTASFLADSMMIRIAADYDPDACIDSIAGTGYSSFTLQTVLIDDSAAAVSLAERWNAGEPDNSVPSVSAPWSRADGSSYRVLSGPVDKIAWSFHPLLSMETGVAHVLPMYGEWCVCILELVPGEWTVDQSASGLGYLNLVSSLSGETVLSRGVAELAENCSVSGTRLVPSGEGSSTPVIITREDTLTTAGVIEIMHLASPESFFGDVPGEIEAFAPPEIMVSPEITAWYYVKAVAQKIALAELAAAEGITLNENALDYARAEAVVRERVLLPSVPDSAGVALWFTENSADFVLPERRSVFLGYTDSTAAAEMDVPESFTMIPSLRTIADSLGNPLATPLQVEESFGEILGPVVFGAPAGELQGPVFIDGELAAWFEVVEVVPPGVPELEEIYPLAASVAANSLFQQGFDGMLMELKEKYPVQIDSVKVTAIDLWGSVQ